MSNSKDIFVDNINISVPTKTLITSSELKLVYSSKYGCVSYNGFGKTTLLKAIANRTLPVPKHIDIFLVEQELNFDPNKTIYEIVSDANFKKTKLLKKINEIESDPEQFERYNKLQQKLLDLGTQKDEPIIRKILFGMGFAYDKQDRPYGSFSGGFRMRTAIARGLYMQPHLLLLDEPTNHLDILSVIWLTDYLKNKWKKTLLIVSHDVNFLDQICNKIIHIENQKLNYYNGNYTSFKKAYNLNIVEKEKQWLKVQKKKKELQKKNTKKEIVEKFMKDNAHFEPQKIYKVKMVFNEPSIVKDPYISLENITFGYDKILFKNINLRIYSQTKIIICGPNSIGKSSILQLIAGQLDNYTGTLTHTQNLKIGYFNQHLTEILPIDKTPVQFLLSEHKNLTKMDAQKYLGSVGLEGKLHNKEIENMSGGQKSRVMLAHIRAIEPHVLLLDEPTNSLDIESIDALITAINNFKGAVIMITHNIEVIEKTDFKLLHLNDQSLREVEYCDYYYGVLDSIEKS
jgi:ATP-binding cassette subfamily F protein 1